MYLDRTYPDLPSLFGAPAAIAVTRVINSWADSYLHGLIAPLILRDIHDHLHPADQSYFRTTREARYGATLEAVTADRAGHLHTFRRALQPLRTVLAQQPWLAGDGPGYADYIIAGTLQWPRVFLPDELLEAADPVSVWLAATLDLYGGLGRRARLARDT